MTAYAVTNVVTGRRTVADGGDLARALAPWFTGAPAYEFIPEGLAALDEALQCGKRRQVRRLCRQLLIALDALD